MTHAEKAEHPLQRSMAVLEDCSDDVLLNIVSRFHRCNQLAGLALVCRRFHCLVLPLLQESSKVIFRQLHFGRIEGNPFRSILQRPQQLRSYALQARLEWNDYESNDEGYPTVIEPADEGELLERAVEDLGISEWEDGDELIGALKQGNQSCRVALLLLMHSNLEDLQIEVLGDDLWLQRVVWKFTSSSPVSPPRNCHAFHALREVTFIRMGEEYGFDLQMLSPFFLLPSIRKIEGQGASKDEDVEFHWDKEHYISTVTELSFIWSTISLQAFQELLRIPKALTRFHYDFGGSNVGYARFEHDRLLAVVKKAQSGLDEANIEIVDDSDEGDVFDF